MGKHGGLEPTKENLGNFFIINDLDVVLCRKKRHLNSNTKGRGFSDQAVLRDGNDK